MFLHVYVFRRRSGAAARLVPRWNLNTFTYASHLLVLDSNGNVVETITDARINGPWDMTSLTDLAMTMRTTSPLRTANTAKVQRCCYQCSERHGGRRWLYRQRRHCGANRSSGKFQFGSGCEVVDSDWFGISRTDRSGCFGNRAHRSRTEQESGHAVRG